MLKQVMTSKQVVNGEKIPNGYGVAYINYTNMKLVLYLFPFNHLYGWVRAVYGLIRHRPLLKYEVDLYIHLLKTQEKYDYLWN